MNLPSWFSENRALVAVLVLALAVRLLGVGYGLPSMYNSDEAVNLVQALSYGAKKSLEPTYYDYPTLYSYALFAVYGIYFLFGRVFGLFDSALDFGAAYFLNPTGLFLVGRLFSVLVGVAAVWVVYRLTERFYSRRLAFLTAALLALSFAHAAASHWILLEAALVLMCALALYCMLRFDQAPNLKSNFWASLLTGLAISTKYNAGFLFVPLFLAITLRFRSDFKALFKHLGCSVAVIILGFLIGSPYWLFSFSSFFHSFSWLLSHVNYGVTGHFTAVPFVWPLWKLIETDWTIGFLFVAGLIYALFKRDRTQILLLAFILPTVLLAGTWTRADVHYLLPLFPALAVLGAGFADNIAALIKSRALRIAAVALLTIPAFLKIAHFDFRLTQRDSRAIAEDWIEENIPENSVIAYENFEYGPNLFDPARFLKNETESRLLPLELKERLLEEKNKRVSYNLVNFRKEFRSQTPSDGESEGSFLQTPYFQRLLQYRLPTLRALKEAGVDYIMVSSDNYDRYLTARPPVKSQPAWVSYQNGRRFYRAVFDSAELTLVNEFKPTSWNMGPTVKVFKFDGE